MVHHGKSVCDVSMQCINVGLTVSSSHVASFVSDVQMMMTKRPPSETVPNRNVIGTRISNRITAKTIQCFMSIPVKFRVMVVTSSIFRSSSN